MSKKQKDQPFRASENTSSSLILEEQRPLSEGTIHEDLETSIRKSIHKSAVLSSDDAPEHDTRATQGLAKSSVRPPSEVVDRSHTKPVRSSTPRDSRPKPGAESSLPRKQSAAPHKAPASDGSLGEERLLTGAASGAVLKGPHGVTIKTPEKGRERIKSAISPEPTLASWGVHIGQDSDPTPENDPSPPLSPASEAAAYAEKAFTPHSRRGPLSALGRAVPQSINTNAARSSDSSERAAGIGIKYGYRASRYAVLGGTRAVKGTYQTAKYHHTLKRDIASGALSVSEAQSVFWHQVKKNAGGVLHGVGWAVKDSISYDVEDFYGSDDLGVQAITKPKNVIIGTKRTLTGTKAAASTLTKGAKTSGRVIASAARTGRRVVQVVSGMAKTASVAAKAGIGAIAAISPYVLVILLALIIVVCIFSIFSIKSDDWELTQTYLYITELDATMEHDIIQNSKRSGVDSFAYYLNGAPVSLEQMEVFTDADLLLAYLDCKYDDYTFSDVRSEIDSLHDALHSLRLEEYTTSSTTTDSEGNEVTTHTTHLDQYLTTEPTLEYITDHKDTLLSADQVERLEALGEVGIYTMRQELASPFVGIDWSSGLTSRFGWRIHPISGDLSCHYALDIAMPGGTPINACMSGTAVVPGYHESYGNYVKIMGNNGTYTLYAHMSSIAISDGQDVEIGDVIGYVGTTGSSTGNHLHIEYFKDGHRLNPLFYLEP